MRVLPAIAASLALGGCSFVFMEKPAPHYDTPPTCSDSRFWPIVDLLFSGASFAGAIAGGSGVREDQRVVAITTGIGWGIVHASSAIIGFGRASDCRDAIADFSSGRGGITPSDEQRRRALERQLQQQPPAPPPPPPAPPPPPQSDAAP